MQFLPSTQGEVYTAFDQESESEVQNIEILQPDLDIKENHPKHIENQSYPIFMFWEGMFYFSLFGWGVEAKLEATTNLTKRSRGTARGLMSGAISANVGLS